MERGRGRGGMLGLLVVQALSEYYRLEKKLPVTAWLIAANTLIYLRPKFLDPILPTLNQVWFNPHLILKCASDEIIELSVLQQPKQHRRSDLLRTASLTFETLPMKSAKHLGVWKSSDDGLAARRFSISLLLVAIPPRSNFLLPFTITTFVCGFLPFDVSV